MMPDLPGIWSSLEEDKQKSRGGILRRRLPLEGDHALYAAVDVASGHRLLLLGVPDPARIAKIAPRWRQMRTKVLRPESEPGTQFLCLELENDRYSEIFSAVAKDLQAALGALPASVDPAKTILGRLRRWHQFFLEHPPEGLQPHQQRGLFAELLFLRNWILQALDAHAAVRAWRGPLGEVHDFRTNGWSAEAKAVLRDMDDAVKIHGAEQLDLPASGNLVLYILSLDEAEEQGLTLPDLVAELRNQLEGSSLAEREFEDRLLQAGYLDNHVERYLTPYICADEAFYRVHDGFPRIVNPPDGVVKVRYDLLLSTCQPHRVNPHEDVLPLLKED